MCIVESTCPGSETSRAAATTRRQHNTAAEHPSTQCGEPRFGRTSVRMLELFRVEWWKCPRQLTVTTEAPPHLPPWSPEVSSSTPICRCQARCETARPEPGWRGGGCSSGASGKSTTIEHSAHGGQKQIDHRWPAGTFRVLR